MTTFFTGKCDAFQEYKCQWCNKTFPSRQSLGSHTKGCKGRPKENKDHKKSSKKNKNDENPDLCIKIDTLITLKYYLFFERI